MGPAGLDGATRATTPPRRPCGSSLALRPWPRHLRLPSERADPRASRGHRDRVGSSSRAGCGMTARYRPALRRGVLQSLAALVLGGSAFLPDDVPTLAELGGFVIVLLGLYGLLTLAFDQVLVDDGRVRVRHVFWEREFTRENSSASTTSIFAGLAKPSPGVLVKRTDGSSTVLVLKPLRRIRSRASSRRGICCTPA